MDINSAKQVIKAAAMADDSVIMEGKHGIGKSNIVRQFADENGYHLEELFLSHQEVGDITGIPKMVERNNTQITTWTMPIWLQRMHEKAWPRVFEFDDLIFNDKEFEDFVKKSLDII